MMCLYRELSLALPRLIIRSTSLYYIGLTGSHFHIGKATIDAKRLDV